MALLDGLATYGGEGIIVQNGAGVALTNLFAARETKAGLLVGKTKSARRDLFEKNLGPGCGGSFRHGSRLDFLAVRFLAGFADIDSAFEERTVFD